MTSIRRQGPPRTRAQTASASASTSASASAKKFHAIHAALAAASQKGERTLSTPSKSPDAIAVQAPKPPPVKKQEFVAIQLPEPTPATPEAKTFCSQSPLKIASKFVTVGIATFVDTLSLSRGIDEEDRALLGFIEPSKENNGWLSGAYALSYARTNGKQICDGVDDTVYMFSERKLPAEWKKLSPRAEKTVVVLTAGSAMYSALAEFTSTRKFCLKLKFGEIASSGLGGLYVITSWLSETFAGWEKTRGIASWISEALADRDKDPDAFLPKKRRPYGPIDFLVYWMAFASGCGAITLSYNNIDSTFEVENDFSKFVILFFSLTKGLTDAAYNQKQYKELLAYPMRLMPRHILFAGIALFAVAAFTDATAVTYHNEARDARLPFNYTLPSGAQSAIGFSAASSLSTIQGFGIFISLDFTYILLKKGLKNLISYCASSEPEDTYQALPEDETTDSKAVVTQKRPTTLYTHSRNRSTLMAAPLKTTDTTPPKSRRNCCGCTIS